MGTVYDFPQTSTLQRTEIVCGPVIEGAVDFVLGSRSHVCAAPETAVLDMRQEARPLDRFESTAWQGTQA